jgi:hypothetical protein
MNPFKIAGAEPSSGGDDLDQGQGHGLIDNTSQHQTPVPEGQRL